MKNTMLKEFSIHELEVQRTGLEDKIRRLRADLKLPMDANLDEQANQVANRVVLLKIYESESSYLKEVNQEIKRRSLSISA